MPSPRFPIPQGTLDMLILQILSLEPAHGYGIAQRLEQISRSVVQVNQGSLYPALHRLEQKGVAAGRMEAIGNGAGSQVLLLDSFRTKAARRRKRQLGAAGGSGPTDFRRGQQVMRQLAELVPPQEAGERPGPRTALPSGPAHQRPGAIRSARMGSSQAGHAGAWRRGADPGGSARRLADSMAAGFRL